MMDDSCCSNRRCSAFTVGSLKEASQPGDPTRSIQLLIVARIRVSGAHACPAGSFSAKLNLFTGKDSSRASSSSSSWKRGAAADASPDCPPPDCLDDGEVKGQTDEDRLTLDFAEAGDLTGWVSAPSILYLNLAASKAAALRGVEVEGEVT